MTRSQYNAARTATKMEKESRANSPASPRKDIFNQEWRKATNKEANARGSLLGLDKDESGSLADITQKQVGNTETTCWQETSPNLGWWLAMCVGW